MFKNAFEKSELIARAQRNKTGGAVDPNRQLPTMPPGQVDHHLKSVAGRILTLIDGAIPDERQNKALKTLIKKEFREEFDRVFRYLYSDVRSTQGCDEAAVYDQV